MVVMLLIDVNLDGHAKIFAKGLPMCKHSIAWILSFGIVCGTGAFAIAQEKKAVSASHDGMTLHAEAAKQIKNGEALPLTVKLVNGSDKAKMVSLLDSQCFPLCKIEVKGADGKPAPYTAFGKETIGRQNRSSIQSIRGFGINPSDTKYLKIANLCLYFDLTVPGEYVVTATTWIGGGIGGHLVGVDLPLRVIDSRSPGPFGALDP
jgi:hypothetical protein